MLGWGVQDHRDQHDKQGQEGWRKGPWTLEEDKLLTEYVALHGEGRWSSVAKCAGLNRSGKSCRLRWVNYLRPGLKRGHITPQEEGIIIELHSLWGNKWSTIARFLPGRTDNEIKNYWRTHFKKKDKSLSRQDKLKRSQNHKKIQQQQQDLKHEPQLQPQPQTHQKDMKIINHDQDISSFMYPSNIIAAAATTATNFTTAALEDQYRMSQCILEPCSSDQSSMFDQGFSWGGLWNLDEEPHGGCSNGGGSRLNQPVGSDCDKTSNVDVQSIQGFPLCGSGEYSYSKFYMGDHIF